jgi:DNA polymerase-3 subunit alpha
MTFASLHHHTTFSYGDGYALPEAHVRRAEEIGLNAMAATEHGNISSHVQLESAAKKAGINLSLELSSTRRARRERHAAQEPSHDPGGESGGVPEPSQLVTKTYAEGFYYEPTADGKMLAAHKRWTGCSIGCQGSVLSSPRWLAESTSLNMMLATHERSGWPHSSSELW